MGGRRSRLPTSGLYAGLFLDTTSRITPNLKLWLNLMPVGEKLIAKCGTPRMQRLRFRDSYEHAFSYSFVDGRSH